MIYYNNEGMKIRKTLKISLDQIRKSLNPPKKDKLIILAWDIETYTERGGDTLAQAEYNEDEVFMICMTVFWKGESKPFLKICLTIQECEKDDDWLIVISKDQESMILEFACCLNRLDPNIVTGFNNT